LYINILNKNNNHTKLIDLIVKVGSVIKHEKTKRAMLAVDRKFFAPNNPYMDSPQPIGFGATISAPVFLNY
jgi:protein-L-isoaspartate(D-aspartate) O-methyltransferase